MNRDQVETMLSQIQSLYPEHGRARRYHDIVTMLARDTTDEGAVRQHLSDYLEEKEKWPSPKQLAAALKGKGVDPWSEAQKQAIKETVADVGHDFCAMGSIPASENCEVCSWVPDADGARSWWVEMGGSEDDRLLRHRHWWLESVEVFEITSRESLNEVQVPYVNLIHAERYCREHAPDGTALKFPHQYHPLRAMEMPGDWDCRSREWGVRHLEEIKIKWPLLLPKFATAEVRSVCTDELDSML